MKILKSILAKSSKHPLKVSKREQQDLILKVLEHAKHTIKSYSIDDPTNQFIDLMIAPTLIDEAIEMLNNQRLSEKSLLSDYLPSIRKD